MKKQKEPSTLMSRIRRWSENNPITVLVILAFSLTSAIVSVVINVLELRSKTHSYYGAIELADQYFASIDAASFEDAKETRAKLIKLSMLSASYELADSLINEGGKQFGFLSSKIMIGVEPDQVVYARDAKRQGKWIVGIDLEAGQGSLDTTQSEIAKIHRAMENIAGEFQDQPNHPLHVAVAQVQAYLTQMKPDFFSISDYEASYGVRLTKE